MRVACGRESDAMTITLRGTPVHEQESAAARPAVIADFGPDGNMVRFEVLRFEILAPSKGCPERSRVVRNAREKPFAPGE